VIPFFAYPAEIRKIIYTTNAIESLQMQLRKVLKNRGHFPSDEAATKLVAIRNITKKWKNPPDNTLLPGHLPWSVTDVLNLKCYRSPDHTTLSPLTNHLSPFPAASGCQDRSGAGLVCDKSVDPLAMQRTKYCLSFVLAASKGDDRLF